MSGHHERGLGPESAVGWHHEQPPDVVVRRLYSGSAWTALKGVVGTNCDTHVRSNQKCVWNAIDPSKWDSWDTHYYG
jgi:hypothetical protein